MLIGFLVGAACVVLLEMPVPAAVLLAAAGGWMEVRVRGI
jgi:hypothetical protein